MDTGTHWDEIYRSKSPGETSWYEPHLQMSLDSIADAANTRSASIIDVVGGESTLVDDLLAQGYRALTVLDLSNTAIHKAQQRSGPDGRTVTWLVGDITTYGLQPAPTTCDDRAVFHFLTGPERRAAYDRQLASALIAGGTAVMATFGPNGPQKCSGLDIVRYDHVSLQAELGPAFRLLWHSTVQHRTPFGTTQQFLYAMFRLEAPKGRTC